MIEPTKKENGYILYELYELYEGEKDPSIFIVLEQWETLESFDNHLHSEVNICYRVA